MLRPNRTASILITLIGAIAFWGAALEIIPLQQNIYLFCLFFGLILFAGGITLLLYRVEDPTPVPLSAVELLEDPVYEEAFRMVLLDESKRGKIDEASLETGINYLVANGISPTDAQRNLSAILSSYVKDAATR